MQAMCFFTASVKFAYPTVTYDPPRRRFPLSVLPHFQKNRPIGSFQESSLWRAVSRAGFHDIEDKHATGAQGAVHSAKELRQSLLAALPVERIVDAFAYRGHRVARRQRGAQKRPYLELCGRSVLARQADHVGRYIDSENLVTAFGQFPGPDAAAAPRIYHQPAGDAVLGQQAQQSGRGLPDETGEARIVNVGQIAIVRPHGYWL